MRRVFFILGMSIWATSAVRADLSDRMPLAPRAEAPSFEISAIHPFEAVPASALAWSHDAAGRWDGLGTADCPAAVSGLGSVPSGQHAGSITAGADREVIQLPPPPSGSVLCLSGLLSIAALQLARSARNIHLGALPAWYHTACPDKIAHAVPFDFDLSVQPLCAFEGVATDFDQRPTLAYRLVRGPCPRFLPQAILLIAAPRGPPVLS